MVQALQQRLIPMVDASIAVKSPASLVTPTARHSGDGKRRVHVGGAVALPRKTVAKAKKSLGRFADHPGQGFNLAGRHATDVFCPRRVARLQMGLKGIRTVRIGLEIFPIGLVVTEQHMHQRAGECAVGPWLNTKEKISLLRRGIVVGINDNNLGAALTPRLQCMGHDIDLGTCGVGAPDDDEIRLAHFPWIHASEASRSGEETIPGHVDADCRMKAGIFFDVTKAVDSVTHNQSHGAGILVGPDSLAPVALLSFKQLLGDLIQSILPTDRRELAAAFFASAFQRLGQAVGMMDSFAIAGNLAADDARRIGLF